MEQIKEVDGKSVVITGSGRGLGRAYALNLASSGANIVVNDVDSESVDSVVNEIAENGGNATGYVGSVADEQHAEGMINLCVSEYSSIDGLVNNAGILWEGPAWETPDPMLEKMVDVNISGSIRCGHAAIRKMLEQDTGGSIVNITSGTHLGSASLSVYSATKGAVASLTYSWALELWETNVRVNALSPLAVTPMKLPPYEGHAFPDDVAETLQFLIGDRSRRIRGQIIRRSHDQIGLIAHPRIGHMYRGDWSVSNIANHFEKLEENCFEPVGYGDKTREP